MDEQPITSSTSEPTFIVGIGASAGGLEALETFFLEMPLHSRMSFVVVQHLSPNFPSLMDQLLARRTHLPILIAEDGMRIEPNTIYLLPPNKHLSVVGRKLKLTPRPARDELAFPIDHFFSSLAKAAGKRAIAIVLSGTGSDGARGICDIKQNGGMVLVQTEETARFNGMPRNAIETGQVDLCLPPNEMADVLLDYVRDPLNWKAKPEPELAVDNPTLRIFQLLKHHYGIDFTLYKPTTVNRRIERRLALGRIEDLPAYTVLLEQDREELDRLYYDLLIGVTQFFRDEEAFDTIAHKILPDLFEQCEPDGEVRLWVAGCATGEEAYSLAILCHEAQERTRHRIRYKILATDVHRRSLDQAGKGIYPEESTAKVSPERLARYFTRHERGYQVIQEIRRFVVLIPHNVISDAPFTNVDFISCRNMLIYLKPRAQQRVLSLFHFSLKRNGVLWLGPSEAPGEISDEFVPVDETWRIYLKLRDVRLPAVMHRPIPGSLSGSPNWQSSASTGRTDDPRSRLMETYDRLLDEYVPSGFLVNEKHEVLHCFRGASEFLKPRDGRPTTDLVEMINPQLRTTLASGLRRAFQEQIPIVYVGVEDPLQPGAELRVTIKPLVRRGNSSADFLVLLEKCGSPNAPKEPAEVDVRHRPQEEMESLELELKHTRESLQATIGELQNANEELQAANEQLIASNEELQSTNEELHSVNEELFTVNAEYQRKIDELTELTDDIDNLLTSTNVHTIFLDRDLCIRKFTPGIAETFNLIPQDVGRRIDSFSYNIDYPRLLEDLHQVLEKEGTLEREVRDRQGHWYLMRILPYITRNEVGGVVVTLIDVSSMKQAEAKLRELSAIVEQSDDAILRVDLDGTVRTWNKGAIALYGYSAREMVGQPISRLASDEVKKETDRFLDQVRKGGHLEHVETRHVCSEGVVIDVSLGISPIRNRQGEILAASVIARDVTAQKRAEADAREAVQRRDQFLAMLSHELRNPLSAILTATILMERDPNDADALERTREVISRQSRQMARLLEDLLDVSRVTRGRIELKKTTFDLTRTIDDALEVVLPDLREANLDLNLDVTSTPLWVDGDTSRLHQVQVNLLKNAIKYTPAGESIYLTLQREGDQAVLRVRDSGVGIRPEMLEKIFDLFVQDDETLARSNGGMGVGLTLARAVIELHGGKIRAYSEGSGQGAVFVVRLPLVEEPGQTVVPKAVPEGQSDARTVVIVEDLADSREMLQALLEMEGYTVHSAADGVSGLELLETIRPDVAFVDIGLPGMCGFDIARKLRENPENDGIFLIALTGYGQASDREAVQEAGFDQHLVKPLVPDDLHQALTNSFAEKSRQHR